MTEQISYKEAHEAFIATDNHGTDVVTILLCLVHIPLLALLLQLTTDYTQPSTYLCFILELVLFVWPSVLVLTVLANYYLVNLMVVCCGILIMLRFQLVQATNQSGSTSFTTINPMNAPRNNFIALFKGANMFVTCMAILAVDFKVFPRGFSKTETFGTSLMDIGVGTFIVSSAITSKFARRIDDFGADESSTTTLESKLRRNSSTSFNTNIKQVLKQLSNYRVLQRLLVLSLGIGRMVVIKLLKYQEHISEYGIHWNFSLRSLPFGPLRKLCINFVQCH